MYIKYLGEDIVVDRITDTLTALAKNKIYKIEYNWDDTKDINAHWIFYIYDDLPEDGFRGYEIPVKNIKALRDFNLDQILDK